MTIDTEFKALCWAANPIFRIVTADSTPGDGPHIETRLIAGLGGGVTVESTWADVCDTTSGEVTVRADKYLRDAFVGFYNLPSYHQSTITAADKTVGAFYVEQTEYLGAVEISDDTSDIRQIIYGGLPYEQYPDTDYLTDIFPDKKFLTWLPDNKKVTRTSKEYLYHIGQWEIGDELRVSVVVHFTDGTSSSATTALTYTFPGGTISGRYYVSLIPVGYVELNIVSMLGGKTPVKYVVIVTDQTDSPKSEERTFVIDDTYYHKPRTLLYRNSLNGFDAIRLNGLYKVTEEMQNQVFGKFNDVDYTPEQGQFSVRGNRLRQTIKTNTGFATLAELNAYREILLSNVVVEDVGGRYLPVQILPGSFAFEDAEKGIYSLDLQYRYLFSNSVYAP